MDKVYKVYWSQTALDELAGILAYPPEVKERIYLDSQTRLMPTLVEESVVWIDGIKYKRENLYWKQRNNTSPITSDKKEMMLLMSSANFWEDFFFSFMRLKIVRRKQARYRAFGH